MGDLSAGAYVPGGTMMRRMPPARMPRSASSNAGMTLPSPSVHLQKQGPSLLSFRKSGTRGCIAHLNALPTMHRAARHWDVGKRG